MPAEKGSVAAKPAEGKEDVIELLDIEGIPSPAAQVRDDSAVAVQEQAAVEAVPAPEPQPKKSRAKRVMAGLLSDDETPAAGPETGGAGAGDVVPGDELVREKWPELVARVAAGKPRLENTLNGSPLTLAEVDGFKNVCFEVVNQAQKAWIENGLLSDMERAFGEILGSGRVHLFVNVKPSEEVEHKVYLPAEKAQELIKTNSEIRNLVKDLELDAN